MQFYQNWFFRPVIDQPFVPAISAKIQASTENNFRNNPSRSSKWPSHNKEKHQQGIEAKNPPKTFSHNKLYWSKVKWLKARRGYSISLSLSFSFLFFVFIYLLAFRLALFFSFSASASKRRNNLEPILSSRLYRSHSKVIGFAKVFLGLGHTPFFLSFEAVYGDALKVKTTIFCLYFSVPCLGIKWIEKKIVVFF